MGNVKIIFGGTKGSKTTDHSLEVFANDKNELFFSIDMNMQHDFGEAFICLDKTTAIKLSREIRKQIALLED
jgi:hypothetical protein